MPPISSPMTLKRIQREISDLMKEQDQLGGISLEPTDDLFVWHSHIPGPEGSPYEGGVFKVDIRIANDYPFTAPKVQFVTRIYHMNISDRGAICMDILKQNWSPALSIFKVILSLSSLLTDPNPADPLVPSIASEYLQNRTQHDRTAKRWTELYAKPVPLRNREGMLERSSLSSFSRKANPSSLNGATVPHCRDSRPLSPPQSAPHVINNHSPIEISDDSDEDTNMHLQSKRKREGRSPREKDGKSGMGNEGTMNTKAPKRHKGVSGLTSVQDIQESVHGTNVITIDD